MTWGFMPWTGLKNSKLQGVYNPSRFSDERTGKKSLFKLSFFLFLFCKMLQRCSSWCDFYWNSFPKHILSGNTLENSSLQPQDLAKCIIDVYIRSNHTWQCFAAYSFWILATYLFVSRYVCEMGIFDSIGLYSLLHSELQVVLCLHFFSKIAAVLAWIEFICWEN